MAAFVADNSSEMYALC